MEQSTDDKSFDDVNQEKRSSKAKKRRERKKRIELLKGKDNGDKLPPDNVSSSSSSKDEGIELPTKKRKMDSMDAQNHNTNEKKKIEPINNNKSENKTKQPSSSSIVQQTKQTPVKHNFEVDYLDHFETPLIAYQHILPFLELVSKSVGKKMSDLIIYDPYFCQGQMKKLLNSLGCHKVINENRDFYQDIQTKNIPVHDVLLTNPPYSGNHKQSLLSYLSTSNKPFALLLPAYTANKSYWRDFSTSFPPSSTPSTSSSSSSSFSSSSSSKTGSRNSSITSSNPNPNPNINPNIFYLMPPISYEYLHPEGTGKSTPPFYSCWFIGGISYCNITRGQITSKLAVSDNVVVWSVQEMQQKNFISGDKRPNPKKRKKMQLQQFANKTS